MYKLVKNDHGGDIKIFISLWTYIRNGPTKVQKAD